MSRVDADQIASASVAQQRAGSLAPGASRGRERLKRRITHM